PNVSLLSAMSLKKEDSQLTGDVNDPTLIIRENERLRDEIKKCKEELDQTTLTFKTVLALKNGNISRIMHENEELRVENAQKTMDLERMLATYENALAANAEKIEDLEAEVMELREKNEELMKEEQNNGEDGSVVMEHPPAAHSDQQQPQLLAVQDCQLSIHLVVSVVAIFIIAYLIGLVLSRY
ncbi:hypothetical protein PMAYCL1PPCAC_22458, partial [Pristionchus mayeri]